MKKVSKIVAFAMAMALACGSAFSAFAANGTPSSKTDTVNNTSITTDATAENMQPGKATVKSADGTEKEVTVESKSVENEKAIADANKAALKDQKNVKATIVGLKDLHVEIPAGGSVQIGLEIPAMREAKQVKVFHWNGSLWEEIKIDGITNNVVYATFTSLSPVMVVIYDEVAAPATPAAPNIVASPNTGYVAVLAVVDAVVNTFAA